MVASIIIPTFNRAIHLSHCLDSLVGLAFESSNYEIIVIDNGSKDNTKEVFDKYKKKYTTHHLKYFHDEAPGLLTGRHRGAIEARGEILVYVDDDILADRDWLYAIVDTFKKHSDIHLVGGKCLPKYETTTPVWLDYFWNHLPDGGKTLGALSLSDYGEFEKEISPLSVWGLNFSIQKKTFYELGGFNPDCIAPAFQHFQGDGETGLSLKAIEKGYKAFYQPKAIVYHEVPVERMTLGYFDKRYFYQGICNSYTEIRRNNGIESGVAFTTLKRTFKNIFRPIYQQLFPKPNTEIQTEIQAELNFEKEMLFSRFKAMERAGYNFHQEIARKSPIVLKWVLKDNYLDYSLPEL